MFFKPRGSITVFICIVLSVLIPLGCILVDLSRYSMAVKQSKSAVQVCAESMLAAYDRQLKEQYGLFALYPRNTEAMEEEIYELLSNNLNVGAAVDGTSDLYGFKIKKVTVIPFYNLSEPYVLNQQIAEFMKYRAPVQVVQEFYEKIKVMIGLMNESNMIEQKMSLDKLMNSIRGSLVNLYFMLKDKLSKINVVPGDNKNTIKDMKLSVINGHIKSAESSIKLANDEVEPIMNAQKKYIELYPGYIKAKSDCDTAQKRVDEIGSQIESLRSKLASEKAKQEKKAKGNSNSTDTDNTITDIEARISDLQEDYGNASNSLALATSDYNDKDSEIDPYRKTLNEKLPKVIDSLTNALQSNNAAQNELGVLSSHISLFQKYHTDLLAMIDELIPQLAEMEKQGESLLNEAKNNDSSASSRIRGDLERQLKCIEKQTFDVIKSQLLANQAKLNYWKSAIDNFSTILSKGTSDLNYVLNSAVEVKNEPQNEQKQYLGYGGYSGIVNGFSSLSTSLDDFKTLSQMKGVYEVPPYALVPDTNAEEENAFNKWYYAKYSSQDQSAPAPAKDDADLKSIRDGVGDFAGEVGKQGESGSSSGGGQADGGEVSGDEESEKDGVNASKIFDFLERKLSIPSFAGSISSEEAIKQIGRAIEESKENQMVAENPFDAPSQGLENVNENEQNFFDYELARIKELLNIVKNAVVNGLEGMMESLYVNEYIVSAFKCASRGNLIEHDIGWDRPLDETFFDKGEVEYILFGKESEEKNIGCSQRSIFAIRLVFNLLHVYTDPQKLATTLSLATTIAGWTIFGVPVVQNFLLISWAGLESFMDTNFLVKGGSVPLIKTSSSWYLKVENLANELKNLFLKKVKDFAQQQIEEKINEVSDSIQETVMGIINSKIDEAFSAVDNSITQAVDNVTDDITKEIDAISNQAFSSEMFENMETFTSGIGNFINDFVKGMAHKLKSYSSEKLCEFKAYLQKKIEDITFKSPFYQGLVKKVKDCANGMLDKGINAAEAQIDKAFGGIGKSNGNNITGRLIMMDYVDYLRLMLLAVPADKKAMRIADLMQLNMQEVSKNNELKINQYKTYIFIKVELDMNTWFLPKGLFRKNNAGMISVEWSQGY